MKWPVYVMLFVVLSLFCSSQPFGMNMNLTLVDATCYDGIQNQNETGIDCGGPCPPCETCFDGIMNQDETGVDCGGVCDPCDTGDSGGGGGGGGGGSGPSGPLPSIKGDTYTKYYFYIKANDTKIMEFNVSELAIYMLEIKFINEVNNITVEIKNRDNDLPIKKQNISGYNYQYIKISATNVDYKDIEYVKIWYKVPDKWVKKQKTSFEDFIMSNYLNDWKKSNTSFLAYDDEYYYFISQDNRLGYFAIIGIEAEQVAIAEKKPTLNPFLKLVEKPLEILNEESTPININRDIAKIVLISVAGLAAVSGLGSLIINFVKKRQNKIVSKGFEHRESPINETKHKPEDAGILKQKERPIKGDYTKDSNFDDRMNELERKLKRL